MRKNLSIESLRGLAAILMAAGHVIGSDATRGMTVGDDSGWRLFYLLLEDVRMPLFAALSGFVYAYRPIDDGGDYGRMVWGKVRRLLVPLITVGTLFVAVQSIIPDTNAASTGDFLRLYVFGVGHFWFLQAIFLVFLLVGVLDLLGVLDRPRYWMVITAAAVLLAIFVRVPEPVDFFSISGAIALLPFFLLGYGAHRFISNPPRVRLVAVVAVAFVVFYAVRALEIVGVVDISLQALLADRVLVGFAAVSLLLLLRDRIRLKPLAWLGQFAFAIYLLHVFGSAAARIVLSRLGIDNDFVVFAVCMLFALAIPTVFEMTLGRIGWISWAFLGQKPYRPRPRQPLPAPDPDTESPSSAIRPVRSRR
ncbi:acyltransferase [Microbacterium pumilum]|uniref:Acyltransferase n=1 Tax=Microbacterium pumilum TaxID=344165 RepID=A0ABN2SA45_9MICO